MPPSSAAPTVMPRRTTRPPSVGLLTSAVGATGTGQVHQVRDGQSIQEAWWRAAPGDVIQVFPGTYKETVYIDKDDIPC